MVEESVRICATCGVEHALTCLPWDARERADGVCAICSDERQWVRVDGIGHNFGRSIDRDAAAAVRRSAGPPVRRSANRYSGWVRGDFDHLT
jgi:hypothetical protein